MTGRRFDQVEVRRRNLRIPFPLSFAARLTGTTVLKLTRRAKYLLATLSSSDTLLMHLGMSGSFRIDGAGDDHSGRHDHVVFHLSSRLIVVFNDPRRFGFMDLVAHDELASHPVLSRLGLEPLSAEFDAAALARACRGKKTSLKVALLDQHVVAGLGNIYVSDALHLARLSPQRFASTIATPSGAPRPTAHRLVTAIKQVLTRAIDRVANEAYRSARFRVYDRAGEPCPRRQCGGIIKRRTQAGRSTFYCPQCQR